MTNNLSTQLYNTLVQPETMRKLLAGFFTDDRQQAVAILQKNGINIANVAPIKDIQIAWLKAIKDSASFRQQAAQVLATYLGRVPGAKAQQSNFVGANQESHRYYNDVTDIGSIDPNAFSSSALAGSIDTSDSSSEDTSSLIAPISPIGIVPTGSATGSISGNSSLIASSVAPPSTSKVSAGGGGGFWGSLGSIFTPSVISTGINTGLNALSTNITANANQTSERNALAIEQTRLAAAQVQASANVNKGLSTGAWVGIIGGVLVLTIVIIAVSRRPKK